MLKCQNQSNILRVILATTLLISLTFFTPIYAEDIEFPNDEDYITYRLTRRSLPNFITSSEITLTFHEPPFSVQIIDNEPVVITESALFPDIFLVDFSADNWTLLFPEVKHDDSIYLWIIVTDTESYEGYTGNSIYPVYNPFEEETLFPFLLNPQDITESPNPKEKHTGKIGDNALLFWIIENPGVKSIIWVEETYGLLLYVIQEVYDPIFGTHDYSLELLECKLGNLVINDPIKNLEIVDLPEDPDPGPTGISGFPIEALMIGTLLVFLIINTRK